VTLSVLEVKTSRADAAPDEIGLSVGVQHLFDTGRFPAQTPPTAKADDLCGRSNHSTADQTERELLNLAGLRMGDRWVLFGLKTIYTAW